jgi:hypothetical protein
MRNANVSVVSAKLVSQWTCGTEIAVMGSSSRAQGCARVAAP